MASISHSRPVVHIVDADDDVQRLLVCSLTAVGIEPRAYIHPGAYLDAGGPDLPGCLVIACQAGVAIVVRASNGGVIGFVEKPLCQEAIVAAICAAIEVDRQRHRASLWQAEVRARFATLSPRERQVMALVTRGRLNKQVGYELGVSEITVKAHRGAAMRKMGARSIVDLVRMADALGENPDPSIRSAGSVPARIAAAADRHSGYRLVLDTQSSFPEAETCPAS